MWSNRSRKLLRSLLLVGALSLVTLVVSDYVGSKTSRSDIVPALLPVLPEDIGAQSRSWRWTQTTGESTHLEVSADAFAQDSDGRGTDLQGVVLKIFHGETATYDRVDSAAMRLLPGGDLFSEGETLIAMGIPEQGERKASAVVTTSGVTFRPAANSARTDREVLYRFENGEGRSNGALYDAGSSTLQLTSDVRIERFPDGRNRAPVTIRAGSLRYSDEGSRIQLGGGARLGQGDQWMECAQADVRMQDGVLERVDCVQARGGESSAEHESIFRASRMHAEYDPGGALRSVQGSGNAVVESRRADELLELRGQALVLRYQTAGPGGGSQLRDAELRGDARVVTSRAGEDAAYTIKSEIILLELSAPAMQIQRLETQGQGQLRHTSAGGEQQQTLDAGRILLRYGSLGQLEHLTASGGAEFVHESAASAASALRTWSDRLEAAYDESTSEVAGIQQSGGFRFEEGNRRGSADQALFEAGGGRLEMNGLASINGDGTAISADHVILDRETGSLEAAGNVSGFLTRAQQEGGGSSDSGLFKTGSPVFFTAGGLESHPEAGTFEYGGGARLWQGSNRIDARTVTVRQLPRGVVANGSVLAQWLTDESDSAGTGEPVSVRADAMEYDESQGMARFLGSVEMRKTGFRVLSNELRTQLASDSPGDPQTGVATGSVRIEALAAGNSQRGFADRAEFGLGDSEVVLAGSPASVEMPEGTRLEGASLIYRVDGDSLQIVGDGARRAYTFRPRGR